MSFINKESQDVPISVAMMKGVVPECTDMCVDNPCHHGGQCINGYKEAICDCFSTDYQGQFCSQLGQNINVVLCLKRYDKITSETPLNLTPSIPKSPVFIHSKNHKQFLYSYISGYTSKAQNYKFIEESEFSVIILAHFQHNG